MTKTEVLEKAKAFQSRFKALDQKKRELDMDTVKFNGELAEWLKGWNGATDEVHLVDMLIRVAELS